MCVKPHGDGCDGRPPVNVETMQSHKSHKLIKSCEAIRSLPYPRKQMKSFSSREARRKYVVKNKKDNSFFTSMPKAWHVHELTRNVLDSSPSQNFRLLDCTLAAASTLETRRSGNRTRGRVQNDWAVNCLSGEEPWLRSSPGVPCQTYRISLPQLIKSLVLE